jgi:hypothetical protein
VRDASADLFDEVRAYDLRIGMLRWRKLVDKLDLAGDAEHGGEG